MEDIDKAMPGYRPTEIPDRWELAGTEGWTAADWQTDFARTRSRIETFLRVRDPIPVLARSAIQLWFAQDEDKDKTLPMEQAQIEIASAIYLQATGPVRTVPFSFGRLMRFWDLTFRNLSGFLRKQPENAALSEAQGNAIRQVRSQTLFYRNLFSKEDCVVTVGKMARTMDVHAEPLLGYKLSDLFSALFRIADIASEQLRTYMQHIAGLSRRAHGDREGILASISFFCSCHPIVSRTWRGRTSRYDDIEKLRDAAMQLAELGYAWAFTLSRDKLSAEFSPPVVEAIYRLSMRRGDLANISPEHIYLNNPVWRKPYIILDDGNLFVPLAGLIYSFPFAIMDGLLEPFASLAKSYERGRTRLLETAIGDAIQTGLPSAKVYSNVVWTDPKLDKEWENDIVAIAGNFIFLFEAKSGRIKAPARRGAIDSIEKNLKELFVEADTQSARLQSYLNEKQSRALLRSKDSGVPLPIDLSNPKVVFKFTICLEHFVTLTSVKSYLQELGLVSEGIKWAPVLTLGELQMIVTFLDSEPALVHYLTRRATLEEVMDFHGDEQDVLSAYLNNGLWIDTEALGGRKIMFVGADGAIRQPKVARRDRTEVDLFGIQLSLMWKDIVTQLYADTGQRHRLDMINTILNQRPPDMWELERRIRRFKRSVGGGGKASLVSKYNIGLREFAVIVHFENKMILPDTFHQLGRNLTMQLLPEGGAVECTAFLFVQKSKSATFSMASFYRYVTPSELGIRSTPA